MNLSAAPLAPDLARLDGAGNLLDADARLIDLIRRAGGDIGLPLPLPELAALASLAARLGIAIARTVLVADGEDDLELYANAEPSTGGVTLTVTGWAQRSTPRGFATADLVVEGDWYLEVDAGLVVTGGSTKDEADVDAMLGRPLADAFGFDEAGLGTYAAFDALPAILRETGQRVRLSGRPRSDARGRFAGYRIGVEMRKPTAAAPPAPGAMFSEGFGAHLDRSLRAPLERIVATASSMSAAVDGPLNEAYSGYAGDIVTAGRHLLGMIADLADLDAIERDDFVILPDAIDLADIARRAAGLLAVRAAEGEVRIDRPAEGEDLAACGDFRRALQVLVNLIGNAVRYSPRGGQVWVRGEREGDVARIIVADQGRGIAATDQSHIFEKFGRVDPGEPGGSGLGLYISRRLARAMGGDITVDSAPGQGARFVFTLPTG